MLMRLRSRLTFANVVALMALFVALSSGAYAVTVPKKSVGTKQLKKSAVTGSKIKKGAVTSRKVKNGSLLGKDFKPGEIPPGPQGPKGDTGAKGDAGPQGPEGNANVTTYSLGAHNFSTAPSFSSSIAAGISDEEFHQTAWVVQIARASGNVYPMPGPGVNGTSQYRVYLFRSANGNVNVQMARASGAGEAYADIRVTRVAASPPAD